MTPADVQRAFNIVAALGEAIRDLKTVPAGHLYAGVMDKLDLPQFTAAIDTLVRCKLVTRKNNLLTWVGDSK